MVAKRKGDVTVSEWGEIRGYLKAGWSIVKVHQETGRSRRTIMKVRDSAREPAARQRATSARVAARRKNVLKLLHKKKVVNGRPLPKYCASAAAMQAGLRKEHGANVSRSTIRTDLAAVAENFVRPRTPFEGRASLLARRYFKRHCRGLSVRKVIFSDEHWLTTNDHTTKTMWVVKGLTRRQRRETLIPRVRKARYNIPSHMIWAAIGVGFKSKLIFIPRQKDADGKTKGLTATRYVSTCLSTISNGQLPDGAIFMQDGARCHTAKTTMHYLERKGISVLLHWPAYSPDLNPIENLWAYLDALIAQNVPTSDADLKRIAIDAWGSIPQSVIDRYVLSFSGKLNTKIG